MASLSINALSARTQDVGFIPEGLFESQDTYHITSTTKHPAMVKSTLNVVMGEAEQLSARPE